MSSLSSRKRFNSAKTKELFKIALEKRPTSIQSLRQSIAISNIKCQRFITTINRSTDIFHTSCNKQENDDIDNEKLPFKKFIRYLYSNLEQPKNTKLAISSKKLSTSSINTWKISLSSRKRHNFLINLYVKVDLWVIQHQSQ